MIKIKSILLFVTSVILTTSVLCQFEIYGQKKSNGSKHSSSSLENKSGWVDIDDSVWIPSTLETEDGISEYLNIYSDNYYIINNRKIALLYSIAYWKNSPLSSTRYYIGFNFIDVTNDKTGSVLPSFKTSSSINKRLVVLWGNEGKSTTLPVDNLSSGGIIVFYPSCKKFQDNFNKYKIFRVEVMTSSGKIYNFAFNLVRRGPVNI